MKFFNSSSVLSGHAPGCDENANPSFLPSTPSYSSSAFVLIGTSIPRHDQRTLIFRSNLPLDSEANRQSGALRIDLAYTLH